MADTKIHDLTLGTMAATDEFPTAISPFGSGDNRKYAISNLSTFLSSTTQTLTNKTFDTAGTGNSFSINGVAATANTGTGSVVRATSPTLVTPVLGVAAGTSLVLTEAVGASALTLTGATQTSSFPVLTATQTWNAGGTTFTAILLNITATASAAASLLMDLQVAAASKFSVTKAGTVTIGGSLSAQSGNLSIGSGSALQFGNAFASLGSTANGFLAINQQASPFGQYIFGMVGVSTMQLGSPDVNGNAVAQTIQGQSGITGTDRNGGDLTIIAGKQTGAGTPGNLVLQVANQLGTGTTAGTAATGLTIKFGLLNMQPSIILGNQALATTATDGFLYIPTCAGTPTGVPTTATGRIAMIYDTTNHQFWFYDSGWKQPKTPAGAAIVTWQ